MCQRTPGFLPRKMPGIGDKGRLFEVLERLSRQRSNILVRLLVEPVYDAMREAPRFEDLLKQIGLDRRFASS
jgi:hypothetical protein